MAVTDVLPGVKITIVVDGAALQEHEDNDIEYDAQKAQKYIEALSGKTFEVHLFVPAATQFQGDSLLFSISVDGKCVDRPILFKSQITHGGLSRVSHGCQVSENMCHKYLFAEITKVENLPMSTSQNGKDLGTISIQIHHMLKQHKRRGSFQPSVPKAFGPVPEKALKGRAVSHSVGFSAPTYPSNSQYWEATHVDPTKTPFAEFRFHYRSREALQSMLIIPRTPSPRANVPLEERDVTTLTQDELLELQRRARAARDNRKETVKVKREPREDSPARRRVRRQGHVTTIELGDDGEIIRETTTSATPEVQPQNVISLDD